MNYVTTRTDEDFPHIDQLHDEFLKQQGSQFFIFREKDRMYGRTNIVDDTKQDTLQGLYFRMRDKINRFKTMVRENTDGTADESIIDTLNDLANYAQIAILVQTDKWK